MNQSQSYKAGAPLTASPATNSTSTITRTADQKAWWVTVTTQAAYLVFDDTTTPSATVGATLEAGFAGFIPVMGNIYCRAASSGAIVNAIPLS